LAASRAATVGEDTLLTTTTLLLIDLLVARGAYRSSTCHNIVINMIQHQIGIEHTALLLTLTIVVLSQSNSLSPTMIIIIIIVRFLLI